MKTIVIATVAAAALMTGCAGLPIPTDKATFQSVADKVQGIRDFEAEGPGVRVQWAQSPQHLLAIRDGSARYTHAVFEFRPAKGDPFTERVALGDYADRSAHYAVLHLRTIGQHDLNGQTCAALKACLYLLPGEYQVRVVMFDGKAPKAHVRVGTVKVDTDRVVARQEPEAKRG
jgi:hypothetical protein